MVLDGFGWIWKGLGERLSLFPGIHLSPCHFPLGSIRALVTFSGFPLGGLRAAGGAGRLRVRLAAVGGGGRLRPFAVEFLAAPNPPVASGVWTSGS